MKKITSIAVALTLLGSATAANAASPSWGLDRIGSTGSATSGSGVRVYVLDTGVANDPGFAGRLSGDIGDCNGHGTHVAGTVGSSEFGVARGAKIISIKVADCGGGVSASGLVAGINRVIAERVAGVPTVVNMSITIGKDKVVDAAINKLYGAGILPVVAAGNFNADACKYSPAGASNALVVGGTNINDNRTNTSNWGSCVDIFAPGGLITSEDAFSNGGSTKIGTSMAAAHVSGAAAVYLSANPSATPAQVVRALLSGARAGVVVDAKGSSNLLLQVVGGSAVTGSVAVSTAPVVAVKATGLSVVSGKLIWSGTDGASYRVETSRNGKSWSLLGTSVDKSIQLTKGGYYRVVTGSLTSNVIKWG